MNPVSSKVVAGAGAAGGSTPLSIVLIWALGLVHVTVPPEIAAAIKAAAQAATIALRSDILRITACPNSASTTSTIRSARSVRLRY